MVATAVGHHIEYVSVTSDFPAQPLNPSHIAQVNQPWEGTKRERKPWSEKETKSALNILRQKASRSSSTGDFFFYSARQSLRKSLRLPRLTGTYDAGSGGWEREPGVTYSELASLPLRQREYPTHCLPLTGFATDVHMGTVGPWTVRKVLIVSPSESCYVNLAPQSQSTTAVVDGNRRNHGKEDCRAHWILAVANKSCGLVASTPI